MLFLAYATEIALIFIHVFIFSKKYLEKKGRSLRITWRYAEGVFHKLWQSLMEGLVGQKSAILVWRKYWTLPKATLSEIL